MDIVGENFKDLFAQGYRARSEKQFAESRAIFIDAVRKAAIEADRSSLAEALCGLAQAERDIGNLPAASHHYENAAILYREMNLPEKVAYAARHEADVLREEGRLAEADPLFREAEAIYRQLGERAALDLANTLRGLALNSESSGKPDIAKAMWSEARDLYAKCKVDAGVAECDRRLAR